MAARIQPSTLLITVNPAKSRGDEARYLIGIMDPLRPRTAIFSVTRTLAELKPVMKKIAEIDPEYELPEVPIKMFGALEPDFIDVQRAAIEAYLNAVAHSKLLCFDTDYLAFVGYSEAASERLQRSHLLLQLSHSMTLSSCFASLVNQSMREPDDAAIATARCWLRGRADFVFVRTLPSLTHPKWPCRKTTLLVEDAARRQYLMTVQPLSAVSILAGSAGPEKLKRVRQMMQRAEPAVFAPLLELDLIEEKLLAVRPLHPAGSLLDLIYDASSPIEATKFATDRSGGGGLSAARLHQAARETFRILRACHAYGFSVPNLLIGNLLVRFTPSGELQLALGGLEDVLAGNSWLPLQSVAPDAEQDMPRRTHVDVLLFGAILYQAASGVVLTPEALQRMIGCQGEVFADDEDLTGDGISIAPQHHVLGQRALQGLAPEVANLLHYVFHPTVPADERVLQYHAFLRIASTIVETAEGGLYAEPDEGALSIKKRDLELIHEQTARWDEERDHKSRRKERHERECAAVTGRSGDGLESASSNGPSVAVLMERRQHKKEREARKRAEAERAAAPAPVVVAAPPPPPTVAVSMAPQPPQMPNFATAGALLQPPPPVVLSAPAPPPPGTAMTTQQFGPYAPPPPPPRPVGIPPPPPKALYNSDVDSDDGFDGL